MDILELVIFNLKLVTLYLLCGLLFCGQRHRRGLWPIEDVGHMFFMSCVWLPIVCAMLFNKVCKWTGWQGWLKDVAAVLVCIPLFAAGVLEKLCMWADKKDVVTIFFGERTQGFKKRDKNGGEHRG